MKRFNVSASLNTLAPLDQYASWSGCDGLLAVVLGKYSDRWYGDYKLWLGIVLWSLHWKAVMVSRGRQDKFLKKFMFVVGADLCCLHVLQFYGQMGVLIFSVAFVCQSVLGLGFTWEKDRAHVGTFEAGSIYEDVSRPVVQLLCVGAGQLCLAWCYWMHIFDNLDPSHVSYTYWLVSILAVQMNGFVTGGTDSLLGKPWDTSLWAKLTANTEVLQFRREPEKRRSVRVSLALQLEGQEKAERQLGPYRLSKAEMCVRQTLGITSNHILRDFLACTVPILLMHFSDPLDFVVYCVGVNFICKLDDISQTEFIVEYCGSASCA
jgi:hypothetical protein